MAEGERPVDEKLSHRSVNYERPSTHVGERCGNCKHFISPHGCQAVASPIQANAYCQRWEGK
jgi:hypothetical protein